jgi:branched-chain amino acid transport system substrate-binding protein
MSNRHKFILAGLGVFVLLAVVVIFSTYSNPTVEPKEYRIGVVLSLTGRGATYGQRALHGMRLAVDELSATKSFRTRPIRLIVEDSRSSAPGALSAFRKLTDVDHVSVVIGFVLSDEVLTCAPVANERRVVLLSTAAGSDQIKDAGDYVFRNRESANLQAEAIAQACIEQFGFRKVAILHSNAAKNCSVTIRN